MPGCLLALALVLRRLRPVIAVAGLAALSACASQQQVDNRVEAQHYAALAKNDYTPPGPPEDPWGPYVVEAAAQYDVPEGWIRSVMRQESGGREYQNGQLIISDKGAMGLMQVEPETYDELRGQFALGDDPYNPHDNIRAGAAYLREMYDLYGSPGFLAAYNAGPARLDKYLAGTATLPDETRRYVASIGPYIQGEMPVSRSAADSLALNQLPLNIAPGLRYGNPYAVASSRRHGHGAIQLASSSHGRHSSAVRYASADMTRASYKTHGGARVQLAMATTRSGHGFHLVSAAMADDVPLRHGAGTSGGWAIQVGAFGSQSQARAAAETARHGAGRSTVGSLHQTHGTIYRARLVGMSREAAVAACQHHHGSCIVLSPGAQS